jgi:hypothetical protein
VFAGFIEPHSNVCSGTWIRATWAVILPRL